MEYNFLTNQAFARIFVAASCVAIGLWSFEIVRQRVLPVTSGIYGLLIVLVLVVAMVSGSLRLDVHGFGLIIFGQAIWFIVLGVLLFRTSRGDPSVSLLA